MNTKLVLGLLTLCLAFSSCSKSTEPQTAIISGKVTINWSNSLTLHDGPVQLTDSWIDRVNIGDSIINLNDDGTFKIELLIDKPNFYTLAHENDKEEVFISPNDSIYIDFGAETLHSGRGAEANNHLRAMRVRINNNRRYINGLEFYNQSSSQVNSILDSLEVVYRKVHQEFKDNNAIDPILDDRILADITYRHKLYQVVHPALYTQRTNNMLPVAKSYYEDIAKDHLDNPNYLRSLDYVLFLDAYATAQAAGDLKYGNYFDAQIEKIHPRYEAIQQLDAHQEIKDYLLHEHLNKSMDSYGMHYLGDLIPQYEKDCKNEAYINEVVGRYEEGVKMRQDPSEIKIYKTIGNIALEAHIFYPANFEVSDQRPAYLFFHGGGWAIGEPEWGYANCKRYSEKGMVAISFEYRIIDIHQSNILDCVRDAKSAILWTRKQAESLGIDPDKIVAAGFSAGGHLAACTAILNDFEEEENSGLSSKPNAIIVHSASYNTTKSSWFARNTNDNAEAISTFHNVDKNLVPSIFFHGTDDHLAPISEFTEFRDKMVALDNDFDYKIFENVGHFFGNPAARREVHALTENFLVELGYIAQ